MSADSGPSVSVVIPVRNGAEHIGRAVVSALAQDYPGSLEVVVADGASSDETRSIVLALADEDHRILLVSNPGGLTPEGLNAAIVASGGSVIVRCDAQSTLPPHYVRRAVHLLDSEEADVVGGTQAAVGRGVWQRSIAVAMNSPFGSGAATYRVGRDPGPTDTVYLGVFRRSTLEQVGLFDESLVRNQDYELNYRIRARGGRVFFHPDLAVEYTPRASLGKLWRQYFQYGQWKRKVLRRHPDSVRARQLAAPMLVLGMLGSLLLVVTPLRLLSAVVPLLYGGAILAFTISELIRRRDVATLLLPVTLPVMHIAWGLGFVTSDGQAPAPQIPRLESR